MPVVPLAIMTAQVMVYDMQMLELPPMNMLMGGYEPIALIAALGPVAPTKHWLAEGEAGQVRETTCTTKRERRREDSAFICRRRKRSGCKSYVS